MQPNRVPAYPGLKLMILGVTNRGYVVASLAPFKLINMDNGLEITVAGWFMPVAWCTAVARKAVDFSRCEYDHR